MWARLEPPKKYKGQEVTVAVWHKIEWTLAPEVVAEVKTKLKGFRELGELYINRDMEDGQSVEYIFSDCQGDHRVQCSNKTPSLIKDIRQFQNDRILNHLPMKLKDAPPITRDEMDALVESYEK